MNRVMIYINETVDAAQAGAAEKLLKGYCERQGYEVIGCIGEDSRAEGMSFPMTLAFIGACYEEGVDGVVTLIPQMISFDEDKVVEVLQKLDDHGIEVETMAGEIQPYYNKMYQPYDKCGECDTQEECELLRHIINGFLCED